MYYPTGGSIELTGASLVEQYRVGVLIFELCYVPEYVFLCDDSQQATAKYNRTKPDCKRCIGVIRVLNILFVTRHRIISKLKWIDDFKMYTYSEAHKK